MIQNDSPHETPLPPHLQIEEVLEPEDIPLQVLLLTMEQARQWRTLDSLLARLSQAENKSGENDT